MIRHRFRLRRRGPLWFCSQCSYNIRTRNQHPVCPDDGTDLILSK